MDSTQQAVTSISYLLPQYVFNTMQLMRDAKANGDTAKYYTYFDNLMKVMVPHIKPKTRLRLQKEIEEMWKLEKSVREDKALNPAERENQILKMHFIFADNREYYIFNALPNIGLGQDVEEGMIDFENVNVDKLAEAVRSDKKDRFEKLDASSIIVKPPEEKKDGD